jgi:hypothetical protein
MPESTLASLAHDKLHYGLEIGSRAAAAAFFRD